MKVSNVSRAGLTSEEIDEIRSQEWHLDCTAIRLTRRGGAKDLVCEGAGEVRVSSDGFLRFKLITNLPDERPSELDALGLVAGVLMPEDKFLDLTVDDVYGRIWKSERLRPNGLISGPSGDVVSGVLDHLYHIETLPIKPTGSRFSWWVDDVLDIPANRDTVTKVSIARGKRKPENYNRNVWSFRCMGIDFLLRPAGKGDTNRSDG